MVITWCWKPHQGDKCGIDLYENRNDIDRDIC